MVAMKQGQSRNHSLTGGTMETTVKLQRCTSKEAIIARVRNKGADRVLCSVCLGFCLFCRFWKILDWALSRREA